MSAAIVSLTGLPLSQLSATASGITFSSIASAIRFRTLERSVTEASPHASLAACAASSASSMSSAPDCGTSVNGSPVAGVRFAEYCPAIGATHSPPMKFS